MNATQTLYREAADKPLADLERINRLADWHIHELMNTTWTQTSGSLRHVRHIHRIFDNLVKRKRLLEFLDVLQVVFTLSGLEYPRAYRELGKHPEARALLTGEIVDKIESCILDFQGVE